MNGICDDTGNDHRVESRYTIRISPDRDVKNHVKQWSVLNDGHPSLKADVGQKANDYCRQKLAYVGGRPNYSSAEQKLEQQHQELYKPMLDLKIAVGNWPRQFDLNSPARFFRNRIAQVYLGVSFQSLSNFFSASRQSSPTMSTRNSRKRSTWPELTTPGRPRPTSFSFRLIAWHLPYGGRLLLPLTRHDTTGHA
ncbi:hypothetical protein R70211_05348 [Paraburkholderia domus]|uniref:Uncharacterized protein n=1 Tax=Paraburkholderia domus TaxID=2793075 RepID=A0A9N8N1E7_9BURK|nr:hypothetical protein R70211_05348 [Paraburkholderia domus]